MGVGGNIMGSFGLVATTKRGKGRCRQARMEALIDVVASTRREQKSINLPQHIEKHVTTCQPKKPLQDRQHGGTSRYNSRVGYNTY